MSDLADWTDPAWTPPGGLLWIDLCPGCGAADYDHCNNPECASHIAVHCHRPHYEEPLAGALMLPVLLRVPWYGSRN